MPHPSNTKKDKNDVFQDVIRASSTNSSGKKTRNLTNPAEMQLFEKKTKPHFFPPENSQKCAKNVQTDEYDFKKQHFVQKLQFNVRNTRDARKNL